MSGWDLKQGSITEYNVSEDRIWSLFNFVFSDSSKKRNTYKFGLIKSLLDNIFNGSKTNDGVFYTYTELFERFAGNYWNLVVKYDLRQMRFDGRSTYSKVEKILKGVVDANSFTSFLEFDAIDAETREKIINEVTKECKRCVIGALYTDFDGIIYSFDLAQAGLTVNYCVYEFMLKHKAEIERLNYYSWAKFLEKVNDDNALVRVIDKLELATPRRSDLSIYREILRREFEEKTCFYCGKKLQQKVHVDHFIPWSFVKDNKIWNFVLACSTCNTRKNDRLPRKDFVIRIEDRNRRMAVIENQLIQTEFQGYTNTLLEQIWYYAKLSGFKELK